MPIGTASAVALKAKTLRINFPAFVIDPDEAKVALIASYT
jgi:hypothetical protein